MLAPARVAKTENTPRAHKRLLKRVLRSDPAQEYLLYLPHTAGEDAPLLVAVHGVSRNADQHARLLSGYCDQYGVVLLAPVFSADDFPNYQQFGRAGPGRRADRALNVIVAEATAIAGINPERFFLFGYSGGAQFAHRYLMAYPHRVAAAAIAGAGWYTLPNPTRRFPYGTRMSKSLSDLRFDAEEFLSIPVTVMVGAEDTGPAGVRRSDRLDREQGTNRLERARNWVAQMQSAAVAHHLEPRVTLVELPRCDHSFRRSILRAGLGSQIFQALFGPPGQCATRDGTPT